MCWYTHENVRVKSYTFVLIRTESSAIKCVSRYCFIITFMLVKGIRQRSGMISFALESPGFESHTDILSLSLSLSSVIFYVVSIISACLSHPKIKLMSQNVHHCYISRPMTKPTKWPVRPAKIQNSLGIRPV